MGVPAFYRWLSEKYPRIVIDMVEQRPRVIDGQVVPLDLTQPNPNQIEFDNLYIDMNGIIHPCAHPEDRPAPKSEAEMFINVMQYVDRIFAAVRPRCLLFLAIDGVAPRAKMNQQRSRRFRSATEARERYESKAEEWQRMVAEGIPVLPDELNKEWDSNVITPGTDFMISLDQYLRYYISQRINSDKAWQQIKVIYSNGNEPGEGEHKIMEFIRRERAQPGYDPNTRHILHGLDADLIMLALATHEPHFTVLREQVFFGRGQAQPRKSQAQETFEVLQGDQEGEDAFSTPEGADRFPYLKPFQMLHIATLREYLEAEFECLRPIPFGYDFERIIDDFIFLCFFVGNDFLPHLPSLDIRDGAIDYLINVYKRKLPAMGSYLTYPGGDINLEKVAVILREVGEKESEVFRLRYEADQRANSRQRRRDSDRQPNSMQDIVEKPLPVDIRALSRTSSTSEVEAPIGNRNMEVAQSMKEILRRKSMELKRQRSGTATGNSDGQTAANDGPSGVSVPPGIPTKKAKVENISISETQEQCNGVTGQTVIRHVEGEISGKSNGESSGPCTDVLVADDRQGNGQVPDLVPHELTGNARAHAQSALAARVKDKFQAKLDRLREETVDPIRYHEPGFKDRYYSDKLKKQNVEKGGGREQMYRAYIEGLCWVFAYYYKGCQAWGWFYPFHYAPFASDLMDPHRYQVQFELGRPLKPLEQLMAVLPPESASALPLPLARLMTDPDSPIRDFYPREVEVDPNGKPMPWLHVVLLPFIDEARLLRAVEAAEQELSEQERSRNILSTSLLFNHESHPIFESITRANDAHDADCGLSFDAESHAGFSGVLCKPTAKVQLSLGGLISAPRLPPGELQDVDENRVLCAGFHLPPARPHFSSLLMGLRPPLRTLTARDLAPRRPPRLGRGGISIAELGLGLDYMDPNSAPHHRMIMQGIGHDSRQPCYYPPHIGLPGNLIYGQQPQTGNRSWGSLEPVNQKYPTAHAYAAPPSTFQSPFYSPQVPSLLPQPPLMGFPRAQPSYGPRGRPVQQVPQAPFQQFPSYGSCGSGLLPPALMSAIVPQISNSPATPPPYPAPPLLPQWAQRPIGPSSGRPSTPPQPSLFSNPAFGANNPQLMTQLRSQVAATLHQRQGGSDSEGQSTQGQRSRWK